MLLWLPIVLLPIVLSVGLAWRRWRNPKWRPLIPGVLATGAGTTFCLVVYRWGFETARCSDRGSVACLLNANQGVISVVALGLAVVGLWGVAINRHFDRRGARNALEHRARTALLAALQETEHNLIHFGLASNLGTNRMVGLPQLSVDETRALCHQDLRAVLHPEVVEAAQNTLRNYEATHVPDDRRSYYHARAFINTSLRSWWRPASTTQNWSGRSLHVRAIRTYVRSLHVESVSSPSTPQRQRRTRLDFEQTTKCCCAGSTMAGLTVSGHDRNASASVTWIMRLTR
jgi:hypothetical protein